MNLAPLISKMSGTSTVYPDLNQILIKAIMDILTSKDSITRKKIRDCEIPAIGLGTHNLKGQACTETVREAIDLGYRHIDTAQAYENEAAVGIGMKESGIKRHELFLTDKIWWDNLRAEEVLTSFENSLDRLQTDYVDLLLIHWPSPEKTPLKETIGALHQLKLDRKARWIGVSNFTPDLLKEALTLNDIMANQVEYHAFLNQDKLLETAQDFSMFLIAYSPLMQGHVTDETALNNLGSKYGKSATQIALRWLIQQKNVIAIPKASTHDHLISNMDVFDFELEISEMEAVHELSKRNKRLVDPAFAPNWY